MVARVVDDIAVNRFLSLVGVKVLPDVPDDIVVLKQLHSKNLSIIQ
jgi:hypothetical protein